MFYIGVAVDRMLTDIMTRRILIMTKSLRW